MKLSTINVKYFYHNIALSLKIFVTGYITGSEVVIASVEKVCVLVLSHDVYKNVF